MIKEGINQAMSAKQYQYQYGDRPLEGYTIQRPAGRGGFGEVYYAISDSGRQVALKVVQNCTQIELRGISQCMNLKSPHLVTIFDIKYNDREVPFVVMEYVSGPSLRQLLDEAPNGLGEQKAAFFLREIAKGLAWLHDCGIVHRDLKPANIFYENGYVKIGDYGLSKAISADHHTGQTITVGTVHYMAPEIGAGNYDRGIDIYALGVLLYEMLTGQVPFFGASPCEVLMKHLSNEPDLTGINESFARVIRKAMAKNPTERYQTVQAMLEDVFGSEHIRNSISQFSPDDLANVARRVAEKVKSGGEPAAKYKVTPPPDGAGTQDYIDDRSWEHFGRKMGQVGDRVREKVRDRVQTIKAARTAGPVAPDPAGGCDPLNKGQRFQLALITLLAITIGTTLLSGARRGEDIFFTALFLGLNIAFATTGIIKGRWHLLRYLEPSPLRSVLACAMGVVAAMAVNVFLLAEGYSYARAIVQSALCLMVLAVMDVWKMTAPDRDKRISLSRAVLAAIFGVMIASVFDIAHPVITGGMLGGVVLALQAVSPYLPPEIRRYYKGHVVTEGVEPQPFVAPPVGMGPEPAAAQTPAGGSPQGQTPPVYQPFPLENQARISPKKRVAALLLACFLGYLGVHRFYAGRIGTGLLWLFSFGLFGFGWLYDVIIILAGEFRDGEGRRVAYWFADAEPAAPPSQPGGAVAFDSRLDHSSYYYGGEFQPVSALLGFIGSVLLLVGLALGLVVALGAPSFVAQCFPHEAAGIQHDVFGDYAGWPKLVNRIVTIVCSIFFFVALVFMIIGRRNRGPVHIIRAVLGMGGCIVTLAMLSEAMPWQWQPDMIAMFQEQQFVGAIDLLLTQIESELVIFACITLIAALVVLAWPARRRAMGGYPIDASVSMAGKAGH